VSTRERAAASADRSVHIDTAVAREWVAHLSPSVAGGAVPVDGVVSTMSTLLECPRLALPWSAPADRRDSLEVKCNLR
jgi:hypothetical protein